MLLETVLLTLLVSTLPLTMAMVSPVLTNILILYLLLTAFDYFGHSQGRVGFMIWIWAIYFTFPGTYSTQPAVTTQVNRVILKVSKFFFKPLLSLLKVTAHLLFIFTWNLGITLKRSKTFNLFA